MSIKLTRHKDLCTCLCLSSSVASKTLEYSSISWLHPAHYQPSCGELVARVGQFGKRHSIFKPLYFGLGHTYTYTRKRQVNSDMKRKSISLANPRITLTPTAEKTVQSTIQIAHTHPTNLSLLFTLLYKYACEFNSC